MDKFSELKAAASALKNMSDRKEKGLRTSPLQINAAAAKMRGMLTADAVLELLAERDADKKRIAELEAKTAMTMGVGSGNGNLFVHGDYDSIKAAQAIVLENESLRAKLATPVRLVDYRNSPDMHTKQYYEAIGFNQGIDACSVALLAAGFTVEGDE
ncbi:hypothetical protein PTR13_04030 [Serratia bockelmannii]|uniref:hypothetical protein n=1 Tax=Serratia TaxID=613 RepID=UPI001A2D71F2|nr:hypothetical protein [Serratia marcescens]HAU5732711.1 hypothetical protein [Serratia marcescens]HAU5753261.1 hypothetical protein [Serratia marcescens]HEI9781106.1 hypothetical protein [Serratia marcescens]